MTYLMWFKASVKILKVCHKFSNSFLCTRSVLAKKRPYRHLIFLLSSINNLKRSPSQYLKHHLLNCTCSKKVKKHISITYISTYFVKCMLFKCTQNTIIGKVWKSCFYCSIVKVILCASEHICSIVRYCFRSFKQP